MAQEPAIAGAEAEHDGQRALGVRVRRLELDVAARRGHEPDTSTFPRMDGVTVVDHVLLRRLLSILRDKDTPHRVFRETMTDAALILGYEAMRGLRGADISVETPLETTAGVRLADEVFVVAILRAGLGLVDGFLRLVPEARVGHLGMYRDEEALRPVGYYENIPSGVEDAEVFVVDPMLATGGSGVQAVARLKRAGAQRLHFVCLVAAPEGVAALREAHPDVWITTADDRSGIGRNRLHPPWAWGRRGPHLRHRSLRFVRADKPVWSCGRPPECGGLPHGLYAVPGVQVDRAGDGDVPARGSMPPLPDHDGAARPVPLAGRRHDA